MSDNALEYYPTSPELRKEQLEYNYQRALERIKFLENKIEALKDRYFKATKIEGVIFKDTVIEKNKRLQVIDSTHIEGKGLRILVELPESAQKRARNDSDK